uniref:Uncharacterized protein n=1 Tax=Tanacetum cinerariifolium TaxID=118510 RepID=A0A699HVF2_TANCI|nr:hypothetical protein [Tanacetum cinerariifolium]
MEVARAVVVDQWSPESVDLQPMRETVIRCMILKNNDYVRLLISPRMMMTKTPMTFQMPDISFIVNIFLDGYTINKTLKEAKAKILLALYQKLDLDPYPNFDILCKKPTNVKNLRRNL